MSKTSFAGLGVSAAVCAALEERGITTPFPVQSMVIADVAAGHDVLVASPTGSGKTLAFSVPLVDRLQATGPRPAALILVPTRELAAQIVEEARTVAHARALSITAVYGGVGIQPQIRAVRKAHILVATPGRLQDLLDRNAVDLSRVQTLILDEADRMLDMGFRPAIDRIVKRTPADRQTLLFSATLDGAPGNLADAYTRDARRHSHRPEVDPKAITEHRFLPVLHEEKIDHLVRELNDDTRGLALVFVRTKRGADRLVKRLGSRGESAVAMHGDRSQAQRQKALARFEAGDVRTLVATDVAARGIDVDGITHVINFDAPEDSDAYVHRVGRTGRAGRSGIGITFVLADQAHDIGRIATGLGLDSQFAGAGFETAPSSHSRPASVRSQRPSRRPRPQRSRGRR
jgi:superfamily II DNA/RNA helicase